MGREKSILIITIFSLISLSLSSSSSSSSLIRRKLTTQDISNSCSKTRYPSLCVKSLLDHPDSANLMNRLGLVRVSFNVTLRRVEKALDGASNISDVSMDKRVRSAYDDCLELLNDSMYQLVRSLSSIGSKNKQTLISNDDVMTWLSAALTNHDTCTEGFEGVTGYVKDRMDEQLKDLSQLVSNCLALFKSVKGAGSSNGDFSGIPIQNRRRKLLGNDFQGSDNGFPSWVKSRERKLLEMSVSDLQPSIVVSKDGNGTYRTITEAIKVAPQNSDRRTIIYVKAGRYEEENLKVGIKKTNLMFIGDGKSVTIISGGKSVADNLTTFHTAAFAATGSGFIVRDITFTNWAGPAKHQAVALRVGADHAVVYRCNIIGYQDSLYVHSQRQFFRECDIYGTVDFIFGNAAVVFQNCGIYARKPMAQQKNTITAQNRKDPNQNTGISIHNCKILATPDLEEAKNVTQTYLGRPWKLYARTVYLMSYMGDHIRPLGWLEWSDTFALDTLYYGEYLNSGPGAPVGQRVKWPGYHVMTSSSEASKFTVGQFLLGSSWLPSTGVTYVAGLSV